MRPTLYYTNWRRLYILQHFPGSAPLAAVEVSSTTEYGGDGRASREGTQESVHRVGAPFIISRWTSTRH